ncbi:RNA polymerase sigma factor, partial [Candidatus Poribacteria bacterium]|nr:RNA polymerase sigma factor [Candidatus Poribacteria bacterium]
MKNDDAQLIQRALAGDDTAFSALVKKYRKPVHALAWRKIGDFHIAEEITQDTFLKVYQRLSTLKAPQSFAGWLYVITTNQCKAWFRKKRTRTQSLENTSSTELEKRAYSEYIIEENERTAKETQREVVKKILAKLQESERTVITLYYLGGMTYGEISEFLGVSEAAVRNRLYRARRRLKKEEPMIREALGNFQITPNLTENIMREISRLKPIAPSGDKPLVPWGTIGVSTLAVVLLMLGVSSQYLARFQKPYNFDAASEMTIEIIEAPIVLNLESEPDDQTQLGSAAAPSENEGAGQQPDAVLFAAAEADGEDVSVPKQQWIQGEPVKGSDANGFLATSEGKFYATADMQVYKLEVDGNRWQHLFNFIVDYENKFTFYEIYVIV